MERKDVSNLTPEAILQGVLEEVDLVRKESYNKLLKNLMALGPNNAIDISTYFFGANPDIEELTKNLLKDLNILK